MAPGPCFLKSRLAADVTDLWEQRYFSWHNFVHSVYEIRLAKVIQLLPRKLIFVVVHCKYFILYRQFLFDHLTCKTCELWLFVSTFPIFWDTEILKLSDFCRGLLYLCRFNLKKQGVIWKLIKIRDIYLGLLFFLQKPKTFIRIQMCNSLKNQELQYMYGETHVSK